MLYFIQISVLLIIGFCTLLLKIKYALNKEQNMPRTNRKRQGAVAVYPEKTVK